ncbi:MAG: hypothetical protein KUG78_21860 [Kangiellaceae bacterium]|nr:hypothetical protein [Kangiellaceae bacterium]
MNQLIKRCSIFLFLVMSQFTSNVSAKIYFSFLTLESEMSEMECINASKKARAALFEDDFGENIIGNSYTYSEELLAINVICLEKKNLIFLNTSAQDHDSSKYLEFFAHYLRKKQ